MNHPTYPIALSLLMLHCGSRPAPRADAAPAVPAYECDGPDQEVQCFFTNLPADLGPVMTIAAPDEPGDRMIIRGRVLRADTKTPYAGAVLYAYNTDITGHYATSDTNDHILRWHGRLHGWCRTDADGRYELHSIRPGAYPNGKAPAHIHAAVQLQNGAAFWINDFVFADDPHLDSLYFKLLREPHNPKELDNGVVTLVPQEGVLVGTRDIAVQDQ
ncbi:MAG: hypothetical protein KA175_12055 [Flavobacteriales bacterium]|nr:hypothetical protein [Flavobacteriales bacterium]MBP6698346.1 hypothetical protein [Flavobacteriales bacterium]